MIFPTCELLIDLGSALATYGGLLYFGKSAFLRFMSFLQTTQFSYEGCTIYVNYYSSLLNGRIHTNIHLFIHVIQSLFFSLFFPVYACENSQQQDLFPVLLFSIIAHSIDLLFLHGIKESRLIKFYRFEEHIQSPIPL